MYDVENNLKVLALRMGLHCVWIRAYESENSPLIQIWIDPSMAMFEPRRKAHELGCHTKEECSCCVTCCEAENGD